MKHPIAMPALSDTMSNGRLVKWLKAIGDPVKHGEVIAEIETDKAIMDVEAFRDGFLSGPLAPVDAQLPVGQAIGYTADTRAEATDGAGDASPGTAAAPPAAATVPAAASAEAAAGVQPAAPAAGTRASPYARRLAQQLGVDLSQPGSTAVALHAADVVAAARRSAYPDLKAGPPYQLERNTSFREATAQAMVATLGTPTFRVTAALPLGPLIARAKAGGRSLSVLLARACAQTIAEHPLFNAAYTPEGMARRERIDIGIAVDSPAGLITPVLRDVARRSPLALFGDWRVLLEKARTRRLTPVEYSGATFYLSDLGVFPGVYSFESIVPQGAAALLSVGAVQGEKALCTLNCDHRVVFGGDAARFLESLERHISELAAADG
ncbi:MAG TPA: dihydrolipoamide acetyltransferase family protein [Steroidobacteraceae bacterium]|nr:dihydrolipoamide acetyltransferase family protein [Steroidobacteraceae bacterium]